MEVEVPLLGHWLEEVEEVVGSLPLSEVVVVEVVEEEVVEVVVLLRLLDRLEEVSVQSFFAPN